MPGMLSSDLLTIGASSFSDSWYSQPVQPTRVSDFHLTRDSQWRKMASIFLQQYEKTCRHWCAVLSNLKSM